MDNKDLYLLKRRKLGITHQELSQALGVSQSMISRYETGKRNFTLIKEYMDYIDKKEVEL